MKPLKSNLSSSHEQQEAISNLGEVVLDVRQLETTFTTEQGPIKVLDGVSFQAKRGQTIGIVGESGCGKSVTSLSIMGLLPRPHGQVTGGEVIYKGQDVTKLPPEKLYEMRGDRIAMIFQEPMTALNPVHTIGEQLCEVFRLHRPEFNKQQRKIEAIKMLKKVDIPAPEKRFDVYPHELSGGMRQRVMIAIALACKPDILIADEPTTALDVTIQAQILSLMKDLQQETGMAIIFITHDLGVVAEICDEVVVMYAGRAVEKTNVFELFENPRHPYSRGLLNSIPRLDDKPKTRLNTIEGSVPSLADMPKGCRFYNRCPDRQNKCESQTPVPEMIADDHMVSCLRLKELS
ncbi:ABC transporter ATP-binding protein [Motilimonas cestriensis]|uniref:ABC transporter ATP-binding protein n=1 Tax=Motilimonas cestriensis TaxID=2742685 RepID=UPI003DA42FE6